MHAALPERGQDLEPVAPGKHQVEQDEVECLVVDDKEPFFARHGDADVVSFGRQTLAESLRNLRLVFDDQDAHDVRHAQGKGTIPAPTVSRT